MSQEKMERMYDAIINGGPVITERTFLINGISKPKNEIDILLKDGTLMMLEKGKYQLASVEKLYTYGIKLLLQNHILRANLCFEKCYIINPNHRDTCLQLFLLAIKNQKHSQAYDILEKMMATESDEYKYDNNLLLYLLTVISDETKDQYAKITKNFKTKDVLSQEQTDQDEIMLRREIMRGKYPHAIQILNDIRNKNTKYKVIYIVLKELLTKAIDKEKSFRTQLSYCIDNESYSTILSILDEKRKKQELSVFHKQIYIITKTIIDVKNTKVIPSTTVIETNDFYKALKGNNFLKAAELNNRFILSKHCNEESEMLQKLLIILNELILEIQKEQENNKKVETQKVEEEPEVDVIQILKDSEELAYYIKEMYKSKDYKILGLLPEQILIIKLVYVRDLYTEGNYFEGDILIKEVSQSFNITSKVIKCINEIIANKYNYKQKQQNPTRRLLNLPPSNHPEEIC